MADPVRLWRYYLPSIQSQGWAEIVLASTGFLGAVSDWGNYAFAWRSFGDRDFREFILEIGPDYAMSKLGPQSGHQDEFDAEKSVQNIRERILEERREGFMSKERARVEWEAAQELDDSPNEAGATRWFDRTRLDDPSELIVYSPSRQLVEFCKQTLPRLKEVIRAELAAESGAPPGEKELEG